VLRPVVQCRCNVRAKAPSISPWHGKTAATASGLRHVTPGAPDSGAREPQLCQVLEATVSERPVSRGAGLVVVRGATVLTPDFGFGRSGVRRGRVARWMFLGAPLHADANPAERQAVSRVACPLLPLKCSVQGRCYFLHWKGWLSLHPCDSEMGQAFDSAWLLLLKKDNGKRWNPEQRSSALYSTSVRTVLRFILSLRFQLITIFSRLHDKNTSNLSWMKKRKTWERKYAETRDQAFPSPNLRARCLAQCLTW